MEEIMKKLFEIEMDKKIIQGQQELKLEFQKTKKKSDY